MSDVVVKESQIKEKGVFATRDFKKGEVILYIDDSHQVKKEQMSTLSEEDQNHTDYIGNGKYCVMQNPEKFINHSCDPNTYVKNRKVVAMRDIKKDEEITYDYSINGVDDWVMECNCGSTNCRKTIFGDFKKLSPDLQKKYEPFLEEWFKKEVNYSK